MCCCDLLRELLFVVARRSKEKKREIFLGVILSNHSIRGDRSSLGQARYVVYYTGALPVYCKLFSKGGHGWQYRGCFQWDLPDFNTKSQRTPMQLVANAKGEKAIFPL